MRKKIHTLRLQKDFNNAFRKGKRLESPCFRTIIASNNLSYSRFAFIASRQVDKRSSVRNTVRRRTREWVRKNTPKTDNHKDILFFFNKNSVSCERPEFYEELEKIIKKIFDRAG